MKALVITQRVDKDDSLLGFFCVWLNALADKISKLYVLTLEMNKADLAKNVELFSLDKERGSGRVKQFLKFNQIAAKLLLKRKVDIVFVHMCPEYVFLCAPYAKLADIPIVMWYAHGSVSLYLRLAHFLADSVVTSSQDGFRMNSNKSVIVGQGIDIEKFKNQKSKIKINGAKKIILSVGRVSPIKNYETLIESADILINQKRIKDLEFQIVGGVPLESQKRYLDFLKNKIKEYKLEDYIQFVGPIPYTQIHDYYQNCDLLVSTSNTGSLDKAILEAMACKKMVCTSNEAFSNLLKDYSHILLFDKNKPDSLAERITRILEMNTEDKDTLANRLREIVVRGHSLNRFTDNLLAVFKDTIDNR